MIPEETRKDYIERPYFCPYCRSLDISGGTIELDYNQTWQEISCLDCGKEWKDVYTLTDIEDEEVRT